MTGLKSFIFKINLDLFDLFVLNLCSYSEDSSICKAGIHYGNIGNKGGELKI